MDGLVPSTSAPKIDQLPERHFRSARGGKDLCRIEALLEVVTPILGGSYRTRAIDAIDIIRVPSLRGHLRFWWRSMNAAQFAGAQALFARETELWGRAATDQGGRSSVEVLVKVEKAGEIDNSPVTPNTVGMYALWPARSDQQGTPPAPRRTHGTKFRLTVTAPHDCETEVVNAIRAWLLFGGYGGRTRRGLGSLTVREHVERWLPSEATRDAFTRLFERDIFEAPARGLCDVPWLAGAGLQVGSTLCDAPAAWTTALGWLKEFRQGTGGSKGDRAREPGPDGRPSISNWPEADKIRHLGKKTSAPPPRHNSAPVWPRAGFGLPIVGRFQTRSRTGDKLDEPGPFELRWSSGADEHDRLASPLIVKALPLADGRFVPSALWLNRAYPTGSVHLRGTPTSSAPFDRLVAAHDTAQFSALAPGSNLRSAFMTWLKLPPRSTRNIAP